MRDDHYGGGYSRSRGANRIERSDSREEPHQTRRRSSNSGDHPGETSYKRQRYAEAAEDSRIESRPRSSQAVRKTPATRSEVAGHSRSRRSDAPPGRRPAQRRNTAHDADMDSYYSEDDLAPKKTLPKATVRPRAQTAIRGRASQQREDVYSYYSEDEIAPAKPSRPKAAGKGRPERPNAARTSSTQIRATTDPYMGTCDNDSYYSEDEPLPNSARPNERLKNAATGRRAGENGHMDTHLDSSDRERMGDPNAVHAGVDFKALYKSAKSRTTSDGNEAQHDNLKDDVRGGRNDRGKRGSRAARRPRSSGSLSADLSDVEARLGLALSTEVNAADDMERDLHDQDDRSRATGSPPRNNRRTGFGWSHTESIAIAEPEDLHATEELHKAVAAKLMDDPDVRRDDTTAASTGYGKAVGVVGVGASGIDFSQVRQLREAAQNLQSRASKAVKPQEPELPKDVRKSVDSSTNGRLESDYFKASPGTVFGPEDRFIIQEELGRGTFSSVFRCRDAAVPGIDYAVKFTKSTYGVGSAHIREATNKEVRLLGRICTQVVEVDPEGARNILGLMYMDAFEHAGHLAMVFQLMKCNLRTAMKKYTQGHGFPLLPTVRKLGKQLFLALRALRRVEVIHCDVKPDNILLALDRETIKLSDFGGARKTVERDRIEYYRSGCYRAPEVILGQPCSSQLDIWSAGATMFELGTGQVLFNGESNNAVVHEILKVCGPFPIHMVVGKFVSKYFNEATGDFKLARSTTKPMQDFANILRPIAQSLEKVSQRPPQGVDPDRFAGFVAFFADFLNRCLVIDPTLRSTPDDALRHKFLAPGL